LDGLGNKFYLDNIYKQIRNPRRQVNKGNVLTVDQITLNMKSMTTGNDA